MLGDFVTRVLILVIGYAYPAFECFKTVEKNRVEIEELRFWCQYWIIVAVLTVSERIGDIFISWLPMYGEMKIVLFIYLWYPKTKGSGYVYETFLRPYLAKHEPDIDRKLQELRARAWDLVIYYWQNFAKTGQTTIFQFIQYVAAQSGRVTETKSEKNEKKYTTTSSAPPPSPAGSPSFHQMANKNKQPSDRKQRPPLPPTSLGSTKRSMVESPKSEAGQVHLHSQAEFIHPQDEPERGSTDGAGSTDESKTGVSRLQAARLKLRRSNGFH